MNNCLLSLLLNSLKLNNTPDTLKQSIIESSVEIWYSWRLRFSKNTLDLDFLESAIQQNSIFKDSEIPDIVAFTTIYQQMRWFKSHQHNYPKITAFLEYNSNRFQKQLSSSKLINPSTIFIPKLGEKILPKANSRNVLITSALPYVNNIPHLGNIIGCVLSADVFARYCRLREYNTLYICGTDEYGTATETKALEEKISCQELCDKYHELHKKTYEWFGIDFDHFGRTTTEKQTEIAQDIFQKLETNGHVLQDSMTQLYCEKHQSFLADRFVEGTCPLCGYADARGDQCDGCGKLLNATELINPHCKLDGATPIIRESQHLFLNLTEQQPKLEEWFKQASTKGEWSSNSSSITQAWLTEGLRPRCITRDLKWGTAVPKVGFENKVFYVWFDAPIGYLSITANYTSEWKQWWKNPEQVQLYQFMGKDNVPFHTVIFPSTLLGTNEPWTLLHHINTTEYLQYESGKFSKSRGVGVFGNNVVDSGIPSAVWRYYLLSNRPESNDSQFTWKSFVASNNNELLANIGNFVNRLIKFVNAKYDGVVPEYQNSNGPLEDKLVRDVNLLLKQYIDALEACKIRTGARLFMDISSLGNTYLQENKLDNNLFLNSRDRCDVVVGTAVNLIYLLGSLIYPYMPTTTDGISRQLNAPIRKITESWTPNDILPGHQIGKSEYLFKRIEESKENELRDKYAGKQSDVQEAPKKSKRKPKSSETKVVDNSLKTPEMIELEARIKEQGDAVRLLKQEKAPAETIKAAVDLLLQLKSNLAK